jgi:ankyrin repeat protein
MFGRFAGAGVLRHWRASSNRLSTAALTTVVSGYAAYCISDWRRVHSKDADADHQLLLRTVHDNDMPALQRVVNRLGASFDPNAQHQYGWTALHIGILL